MSYQQAIEKAWGAISATADDGNKQVKVKLLGDTYTVDLKAKTILSDSCNVPAKEYVSIILLHYLAKKANLKELPRPTGEWIDFKELAGGEGYYPAFKKRTIDRIVKKYGADPDALKTVLRRMPGKPGDKDDVSVVIRPFEETAILITMSKADEEFGPDAAILFDKNISAIFCTEDIVVLTEMVVHLL
ncbi:MAG: DUF3786 domain-containing protein [Candidatus Omnitrophica bacterium]|nr:DUF3786 domain-containing protein [Candidatus Omnitrophota bacterium]